MINLNKLPVDQKPVDKKYTDDELVEAIVTEEIVRDEVLCELSTIERACSSYMNLSVLGRIKDQMPDDALWETYSEEAWNVNETIKNVLEKFRIFFKKVFNYIGSFVIMRIKASTTVIQTWQSTLGDTQVDKDKIAKIFEDLTDTKYPPVESLINCLNHAAKAYTELSNKVNQIKTMTNPPGNSDAEQNKLAENLKIEEIPAYKEYMKLYEDVVNRLPSGEKDGKEGVSYIEGKWNDVASIDNLVKACQQVTSSLLNIKRLQANCDAIVAELSKPKDTPDEGLKNLNNEKIKFLKTFSKTVLSGMMSGMAKITSVGAKACNTFNGKYSTKPKE